MNIEKGDLVKLANTIREEIAKNFENKKLSGNLVKTIKIIVNPDNVQVFIPAEKYDINYYREKKIIRRKAGSYAYEVNRSGGFSGQHKGYIEKSIKLAIDRWTKTVMKSTDYGISYGEVVI